MEAEWFPQAKEVPSAKVGAEANGNRFWGEEGSSAGGLFPTGFNHQCKILLCFIEAVEAKHQGKMLKKDLQRCHPVA